MSVRFAWSLSIRPVCACLLLADCGGGSDSQPMYKVGGVVSGLTGSGLVLQNNGGDDLNITSNGSFVFSTPLPADAAYSVTVHHQATDPTLNCIVMNAGRKGVVQSANVTAVSVVCTAVAQLAYTGYVSSQPALLALRIDPGSGRLTYLPGSQTQVETTWAFTPARGGHYAYGLGGEGIAGYAIDDNSGTLATLTGSPYGVGAVPPDPGCVSNPPVFCIGVPSVSQLAVDPLGQHLYAYYFQIYAPALPGTLTVSSIVAFTIDPTAGTLTRLPVPEAGVNFAASPDGMEIEPHGRFLYTGAGPDVHTGGPGGVEHYVIDAMTGALTDSEIDSTAAWPLSFEPEGRFTYGPPNAQGGAAQAYAIDPITGGLTHIGSDVAAPGLNALVVDPAGAFAYGACTGGICGFSLNPTNGQLTALPGSPFATGAALSSLEFDPSGKFLFSICGTAICVYVPDPVTGVPKLAPTSPVVLGVTVESIVVTN